MEILIHYYRRKFNTSEIKNFSEMKIIFIFTMEQRRNNQHQRFMQQQQTNNTNESPQYPIVAPIKLSPSRKQRNVPNRKLKPNNHRNEIEANNRPKNTDFNSNILSIQSPNNNERSNLPRMNDIAIQTSQSRCNHQQINRNYNELTNRPLNNQNSQSIQIKEPEYSIVNPDNSESNKSPRRINTKRIGNRDIQTQSRNDNISNNNVEPSINVKRDPWDDYIINDIDVNEKKMCAICICDFEIGENVVKLECDHIFHKSCIIPWYDDNIISPTCPICRKKLTYNFSQIIDFLNESESILADGKSLLTEANSYLQGINSTCESTNRFEKAEKIRYYLERIHSYLKIIIFYVNITNSFAMPLDINETQLKLLTSRINSFLEQETPFIEQSKIFIEKSSTFLENLKDEESLLHSNEEIPNSYDPIRYRFGNNSHETIHNSKCCILI